MVHLFVIMAGASMGVVIAMLLEIRDVKKRPFADIDKIIIYIELVKLIQILLIINHNQPSFGVLLDVELMVV